LLWPDPQVSGHEGLLGLSIQMRRPDHAFIGEISEISLGQQSRFFVSAPIVENACHTSCPANCEYVLSSGEHTFIQYPGPMLSVCVLKNRPEASGRKAEYQK
jgi:hypothetical protein